MAEGLVQLKERVAERLRRFAADPQSSWQAAKEAGVQTLTGLLMGMSVFPLIEPLAGAAAAGDLTTVMALGNLAAQLGINLISDRLGGAQTETDVARAVEGALGDLPDLGPRLDAALERLAVLETILEALAEADRRWFVQTLREEFARIPGLRHAQTVLGDWIAGDKVLADKILGDKVMGSKFHIVNFYLSAPGEAQFDATAYREALDRYLDWVGHSYGQLNLRGIERRQERVLSLSLDDVYVPLDVDVVPDRRERQAPREKSRMAGEQRPGPSLAEGQVRRISMKDLLGLGLRQVVIGGPGCGKTTVLRYVACLLARAIREGDPALAREKLGLEEPLPLPVYVPLSEYNQHRRRMAGQRDPRAGTLTAFIGHHLIRQEAVRGLPHDFFERLLVGGRACILLLDGLDEVADERERVLVRRAVENLANGAPQARCVVTSRTRAYGGEAVLPEEFRVCHVRPLDETHVETLVSYWCRAVYADPAERAREQEELLRAIRNLEALRTQKGEPSLVDTPLMVTIVAIVHYNRRRLPDQRVELYDECVKVLLSEAHHPPSEVQFALADWGGTLAEKRNLLSYLAFEMHRSGQDRGRVIAEGRLRATLRPRFERRYPGQAGERLDEFVRAMRERGSLLDERGGRYQFTHLSFQEFLAARHLAESVREVDKIVAFLADGERVTDSWWREPILLTAGYLAVSSDEQAMGLVHGLARMTGEPRRQLAAAELAGTALVEMAAAGSAAREEVANRLVALLTDRQVTGLTPRERARAGRALGLLGDPRDLDVFVEVPAGEFWMGSETKAAFDNEKPVHRLHLETFHIACYPVTNAQYARFVDAGGYDERRYWTEAGWAWRQGDFGQKPEDYEDEWWKWITDRQHFDRPEFWDDPRWNVPNHPVVGITWHEAVAYCRWLTERLQVAGGKLQVWRNGQLETLKLESGTFEARLPTEAEWEKAARGGRDRREYPWGDTFDAARLNLKVGDEPVEATSAVGIFPQGASPYGVLDMSGNVWEWTSSLWGRKFRTPEYGYPYQAADGREDLGAEGNRVLRGGSWAVNYERYARCAYRFNDPPASFYDFFGFRVIVDSPHSPAHS